jgi:hypothetical protein
MERPGGKGDGGLHERKATHIPAWLFQEIICQLH